jgi:hypothetical protein
MKRSAYAQTIAAAGKGDRRGDTPELVHAGRETRTSPFARHYLRVIALRCDPA